MRLLILVFLVLSVMHVRAQTFEGSVKWAIKMEYKDSTRQAQLLKDQEKGARHHQQQMPEIPDGKEMPQTPNGSAPVSKPQKKREAAFPTSMIVKTKNGNARIKMMGGGRDRETLYVKEKDEFYSLDHDEKTYALMPHVKQAANKESEITFEKTSDVRTILGYQCTKYMAQITEKNKPATQEIWVTRDITGLDMTSLSRQRFGRYRFAIDKVEGVPLSMSVITQDSNYSMQVTEIKPEPLEDKVFSVPSGYVEESQKN